MLNVDELLNEGATAIVDDSFTKCFKSTPSDPWNWNVYLFPVWCVGCLVRHLLLFPLRYERPTKKPSPAPHLTASASLNSGVVGARLTPETCLTTSDGAQLSLSAR